MIAECENLVNKTRRLSKFADESLAKVEKIRGAIESKKFNARARKRLDMSETPKRHVSETPHLPGLVKPEP